MRIKHFSGYGSVTATKLKKNTFTDNFGEKTTELKIQVKGNHERGLVRDDDYEIYHWLIKRFDKKVKDYYEIFRTIESSCHTDYITENGVCMETATYIITYKA